MHSLLTPNNFALRANLCLVNIEQYVIHVLDFFLAFFQVISSLLSICHPESRDQLGAYKRCGAYEIPHVKLRIDDENIREIYHPKCHVKQKHIKVRCLWRQATP